MMAVAKVAVICVALAALFAGNAHDSRRPGVDPEPLEGGGVAQGYRVIGGWIDES